MSKIKKKPTDIFRSWRWESEFDEKTFESIGNIQTRKGIVWTASTWNDLADFTNKKHLFAVCIRAVCMNESEEWGVSSIIYPDQKIKIAELEDFYFDYRKALLSEVQTRHIVDVGWVIQTYANRNTVEGDKWWQVGSIKASKERQELWRYYHNVVKVAA